MLRIRSGYQRGQPHQRGYDWFILIYMVQSTELTYALEADLTVEEFREVLRESGLGERRPVDDEDRLKRMLRGASLIVTARDGARLVGVARSISDWAYCCYLSDLAVVRQAQGRGVGGMLIERTRAELGPEVSVLLLAAPGAVSFYEHIGMPRHPHCFWYRGAS